MAKLKLLATGAMGALGVAALMAGSAQAQSVGQKLTDAVTGGTVHLQLRPRFAHIEDDANPKDSNAFTMRSVLGYETGRFYGFGVYGEAINVSAFGGEAYNSGLNGKTDRPVEGDPGTTEVNQIYLSYEVPPDTYIKGVNLGGMNLKYGRQHIALQNHRWIGDVGWRQKPQMYDGASLIYTAPYGSQFFYSYLYDVERPTAQDSPKSDVRLNAHLINLDLAFDHWLGVPIHLIGYGYLFNYGRNQTALSMSGDLAGESSNKFSNKTFGVRLDGAFPFTANEQALTLLYTAEYANQSDYASGSSVIDAEYIFGQLGFEWFGVHLSGAYELLGGDGNYALQTPFSTLHGHNGWADRFVTTPAQGLEDVWVQAGVNTPAAWGPALGGIEILSRFHDFNSDAGSIHYGNEFDIQAGKELTRQLSLLLKYANYWADGDNTPSTQLATNISQDTQRWWVQAQFQF